MITIGAAVDDLFLSWIGSREEITESKVLDFMVIWDNFGVKRLNLVLEADLVCGEETGEDIYFHNILQIPDYDWTILTCQSNQTNGVIVV